MKEFLKMFAAAVLVTAAASCNKEMTALSPDAAEVNGDCYSGSLKVFTYKPIGNALLYIGDVDEEQGTCTVFLPSYEKEGKTIPVIAVPNVLMVHEGNTVTYSHPKDQFGIGDTVYHFPSGLHGKAFAGTDGTVSIEMDYDIKPGKMPFPLNHHFEGKNITNN